MKKGKLNRYAIFVAVVFFIGTLFPYAYSATDNTLKKLRTFINVLEFIKENYVEATDTDQLIEGAIKGMVGELDDFSQYLDPKDYKSLKNETQGDFGGLGIRLQKIDGFVTVVTPMPGTPAFKAGVMPGDRIVAVDDRDITDFKLDEAVELMRGKVGSKVKVTMTRKDAKTGEYSKLPDFNFKRERIVPEVVHYRMLDGKVGYVYMVEFTGHSVEEAQKALKKLKDEGMTSLIFDLRFNPGGLLTEAVDLAKLFLHKDQLIVYTKGRQAKYYQEFKTSDDGIYSSLPMAVLVNQGSASASEILSGALQDHKRATILGQRSFGKASVQQVLPLAGGAGLKLTIAKYYTPLGRLIHRDYRDKAKADIGGIFPDVEVVMDPADEVKVFTQYQEVIYTPGKQAPKMNFTAKDAVLDKAVAILTGKETLEHAKEVSAQEAQKRKQEADKKDAKATKDGEK